MDLKTYLTNHPIWSFAKFLASVIVSCAIYASYLWAWSLPCHEPGSQARAIVMLLGAGVLLAAFCGSMLYQHFELMASPPIYLYITLKNELIVKGEDFEDSPIKKVFPGYPGWKDFLLEHPVLQIRRGWYNFEITVEEDTPTWRVRYRRLGLSYILEIKERYSQSGFVFQGWKPEEVFRDALRAMSGGSFVNDIANAADSRLQSERVRDFKKAKRLVGRMRSSMRNKD